MFQELLALATIIITTAAILWKMRNLANRIDEVVSTDEAGRSLGDRVQALEYQLNPVGGATLSERVRRMENTQAGIDTKVEVIYQFILNMRP